MLIDEYDKPILDHIIRIETAEANRMVIRDFYGILKSMDACIKFIFFTGVSKFTKTSVFSTLNNLSDITMSKKYANICGIPVGELEVYFGDRIEDMESNGVFQNLRESILFWHDGYSWDGSTKLLNPYGLISFFQHEEFKSFWYASGSPTYLIDLIKQKPESIPELKDLVILESALDAIDIKNLEIGSLLFQTGYLTVAERMQPDQNRAPEYLLEIPNFEVRDAFFRQLTAGLVEKEHIVTDGYYLQIKKALEAGDMQGILNVLKSLFSGIPYQLHVDAKAYYHSIFVAVMNVLGFKTGAEVSVSRGRIDADLELGDKIYVFEFKYEKCPPGADEETKRKISEKALENGMKQIREEGYANKYTGSGKTLYLAAFAFLGRDSIEMRTSFADGINLLNG